MNTEVHNLSGVALIIEDRILLVKPLKYKNLKNMWSIPKGHVVGHDKLLSSLDELYEETGILLNNNYHNTFDIVYTKNYKKNLTVFLYKYDKTLLNNILIEDWIIDPSMYNTNEIACAKFIKLPKAYIKMEYHMSELLNHVNDIIGSSI